MSLLHVLDWISFSTFSKNTKIKKHLLGLEITKSWRFDTLNPDGCSLISLLLFLSISFLEEVCTHVLLGLLDLPSLSSCLILVESKDLSSHTLTNRLELTESKHNLWLCTHTGFSV